MTNAQYNTLVSLITALQAEVNTLKKDKANQTDLTSLQGNVTSVQTQVDNIITDTNVDTRTTLYNGSANAIGEYTLSGNITDYKYLIVYADCNHKTKGRGMEKSQIINTSDIVDNAGGSIQWSFVFMVPLNKDLIMRLHFHLKNRHQNLLLQILELMFLLLMLELGQHHVYTK